MQKSAKVEFTIWDWGHDDYVSKSKWSPVFLKTSLWPHRTVWTCSRNQDFAKSIVHKPKMKHESCVTLEFKVAHTPQNWCDKDSNPCRNHVTESLTRVCIESITTMLQKHRYCTDLTQPIKTICLLYFMIIEILTNFIILDLQRWVIENFRSFLIVQLARDEIFKAIYRILLAYTHFAVLNVVILPVIRHLTKVYFKLN